MSSSRTFPHPGTLSSQPYLARAYTPNNVKPGNTVKPENMQNQGICKIREICNTLKSFLFVGHLISSI